MTHDDIQKLAYALSHDMGAPIRQIQSYLSLLKNEEDIDPEFQANCMDKIEILAGKLESMKTGIVHYLRAISTDYESTTVDVTALINQLIANRSNITFSGPDSLTIETKADMLKIILLEILDNAQKFKHPDRDIVINISLQSENESTLISISDNGIGIQEASIGHLFKLFYQTPDSKAIPGSGCGLALVYHLLNSNNGTIDISSVKDEGSTVTIRLK